MDPQSFSIPKQSDQNLLAALGSIKRDFEGLMNFWVTVTPHHGGNSLEILDAEPEKSETIQYLVSEHSRIAPYLNLVDTAPPQNRKTAITIRRLPERITEEVTVHWNSWAAQLPPQEQSRFYVKMFASARKHLQATTVEASLAGRVTTLGAGIVTLKLRF